MKFEIFECMYILSALPYVENIVLMLYLTTNSKNYDSSTGNGPDRDSTTEVHLNKAKTVHYQERQNPLLLSWGLQRRIKIDYCNTKRMRNLLLGTTQKVLFHLLNPWVCVWWCYDLEKQVSLLPSFDVSHNVSLTEKEKEGYLKLLVYRGNNLLLFTSQSWVFTAAFFT